MAPMERHGGWTGAARIAALAALILLSFAGGGGAAAAADPIGADRLTGLDAYLARAREEMGIPGVALVVVEGDQIVHLTALGVADGSGRPVTPQTPFMLASVSKAFTAMAVLQQVEAGRLDLDAPAQRYLPWFAVADTDAATQITLHQLLYHTSGLSPTSGQAYHDSDDQDVGALERAVRALASTSLVAAPGAEHQYSNSNYDVLGLIVEAVSGEPFSAYIEEHVFAALDMTHSHALLRSAQADGLAAGYYHWFGLAWQPAPIPLPRAGGPSATMFASAEDLGHQLIAHLNEGHYGSNRVLSPAGIATLHAAGVETDEFNGYAMGWNVRPLWEALPSDDPERRPGVRAASAPRTWGRVAERAHLRGVRPGTGLGLRVARQRRGLRGGLALLAAGRERPAHPDGSRSAWLEPGGGPAHPARPARGRPPVAGGAR